MKRVIQSIFFPIQENNFQAPIFKSDFLFRTVMLFFILRIIVLPFYANFPRSMFFAQVTSSDIFELLNKQRESSGLVSLREDPKLQEAALLKAQHMMDEDYFGHKSPGGISGWYWIEKAGYDYEVAGENLAIGFLDSEEVHQAWNESPLHQGNMTSSRFQDVGIAVLTGDFQGHETTVVVQLFGRPKSITQGEIILPVVSETEEPGPETEPRELAPEQEVVLVPEEVPKQFSEKIPKGEVAPEVVIAPEISEKQKEPSVQYGFWEFLFKRYSDFLRKVIFVVAILMTILFILNVVAIISSALPLSRKRALLKQLVPAASMAVTLLVFLGALDKSVLVRIIPHHLEI